MFIKNAWYIACRSKLVDKKPIYRRIVQQSLVLFRDSEGRVCALEDRCCHRGVPLSKGFVKQGCITCPYHGWQFDRSGACINIPELDLLNQKIPKRAKIASFQTWEKGGYIWVFLGNPDLAMQTPCPDFPFLEDRSWACSFNSAENLPCDWLHMTENILDGAHLPFVHDKSLENGNRWIFNWSRKFRKEKKNNKGHATGILDSQMTETGFIACSENPEERLAFKFCVHAPSTVLIELNFGHRKVRVWVHVAPIEEGTCRIEHAFCRNFLTTPLFNPLFKKVGYKFLAEDIAIVRHQPTYRRDNASWEVSTLRDKIPLILRGLVYKLKEKESINNGFVSECADKNQPCEANGSG